MNDENRMTYQVRSNHSKFETREADGEMYISGYFAVFNSEYEMWPGAVETIADTAFDGALADDIRCLIDHETRLVLGRNKAGTLTLKVDARGLWGEVKVNPNDQDAVNLYERVKRGDVDQCSFGFIILAEERRVLENGDVQYVILKVRLLEVSVVTFPAYEDTSVSARARQEENIRQRVFAERKEKLREKLKGAT